jgi:predicted transcriptional regulator
MEIDALFNELSSKVRLGILEMLKEGERRFSEIVNAVELSSPEVSRHLKRLREANLVDKLPSGGYRLSLFGETATRMTANIPALMEKSEYFLSHDTSVIPTRLLRDLESISEARIETVFSLMGRLIKSLGEAEYYWDISNQMQVSETAMFDSLNLGELELEIRYIISPDMADAITALKEETDVKVQVKTYENINFTVGVSNNMAFFALPDQSGVINRNTYIIGDSPKFIEWCREFYLHYWEKAELL